MKAALAPDGKTLLVALDEKHPLYRRLRAWAAPPQNAELLTLVEADPSYRARVGRLTARGVDLLEALRTAYADRDLAESADLDAQGGALPKVAPEALKRADFITLPPDAPGTNCYNCLHNTDGVCQQATIKGQPVTKRNCCYYWDNPQALRSWQKDLTESHDEDRDGALRDFLDSLPADVKDGLCVYTNPGPPRLVVIDLMDWWHPKGGKTVGWQDKLKKAASQWAGDEARVMFQNEGSLPDKDKGWSSNLVESVEPELPEELLALAEEFLRTPTAVLEAPEAAPGFTGVITDKLNRKEYYEQGRHVAGPEQAQTPQPARALSPQEQKQQQEEQRVARRRQQLPSALAEKVRPSGASVGFHPTRVHPDAARTSLQAMFPAVHPDDEKGLHQALVSCLGAPDDSRVIVQYASPTLLQVRVSHPTISRCERWLINDETGRHIENDLFILDPGHTGQGLGTEMFSRQVANASVAGFNRIKTHAAGAKGAEMNGYYTWPLLGYDAPLEELDEDLVERVKAEYPEAQSVRDVLLSPGGPAWWKEHGSDFDNAIFDLKPGSESLQILATYLERKRAKETPHA